MALAAPALARAQLGAAESSALTSRQHVGSVGEQGRRAGGLGVGRRARYLGCGRLRDCSATCCAHHVYACPPPAAQHACGQLQHGCRGGSAAWRQRRRRPTASRSGGWW